MKGNASSLPFSNTETTKPFPPEIELAKCRAMRNPRNVMNLMSAVVAVVSKAVIGLGAVAHLAD